jgi:hypothetical protein
VRNPRPLFEDVSEIPTLSERKRLFLSSLRSRGESGSKYRRYLGAPVRYPGAKATLSGT